MRVGKARAKSSISTADETSVTVRGLDLAKELMPQASFSEFYFVLVAGRKPSDIERRLLDATLISIAEHGMTPSVAAARMTLAAAPEALQGAVAAGILGCGSKVLGTASDAAVLLQDGVEASGGDPDQLAGQAAAAVGRIRAERRLLPGFGHPLHRQGDPRAQSLFALAQSLGTSGLHCRYALELERAANEAFGRPMVLNVSCAIPAVLLDVGFPARAMRGIPILARTAGLIAHLVEEMEHPAGFAMAGAAAEAVPYVPGD
ncbi:citryl-CoA lyase [Paracoccus subflavus]|uniref:citrate synthase (unknown stereospecificity) n=1 Tax=Paracoccus subflavus TaxID=2528244 RepID=A0A4V2JBQ8_9RHOB|nr:citryl-CoA lyase [Paracoccus subflavus]TBN36353.1 citryl-CoA lyase [Paracoccus subflavus]